MFLGIVLYETGRLSDARAAFERSIELRPDHYEAWNNLGNLLTELGDVANANAMLHRSLELRPDPHRHSSFLFNLHHDAKLSARFVFDQHCRWSDRYARPLYPTAPPNFANDRTPGRRLRVAYLSPELREHPGVRFLEPVLANHDPAAVEVYIYSDVLPAEADETTARIKAMPAIAVWREVHRLDDAEFAEQLRADEIDIIIDTVGHIAGRRLLALARRPAPVQAHYNAYVHSTGLETMDYLLTDALRDPPADPADARADAPAAQPFVERLYRVPVTSQCYAPPAVAPPVTATPPALRTGRVTFASLNKPFKSSPPALAAWARVLRAVPGSRLVLVVNPGDAQGAYPRDELARHGIGPDRLTLVPRRGLKAYFDLFAEVDIAVDPWPYNGHTTTLDGLWMGVPVVALEGDRRVSRVSAGILRLLGMEGLVASDVDGYVQLAARLAADLPRLVDLRQSLRDRLRASPLMDGPALARRLEAAYREMWRQWCTGEPRE